MVDDRSIFACGQNNLLAGGGILDVHRRNCGTRRQVNLDPLVGVGIEVRESHTACQVHRAQVVTLAVDGYQRPQTAQIERSERTLTSHNGSQRSTALDSQTRQFGIVVAIESEERGTTRKVERVQTDVDKLQRIKSLTVLGREARNITLVQSCEFV